VIRLAKRVNSKYNLKIFIISLQSAAIYDKMEFWFQKYFAEKIWIFSKISEKQASLSENERFFKIKLHSLFATLDVRPFVVGHWTRSQFICFLDLFFSCVQLYWKTSLSGYIDVRRLITIKV